MSIVLGQIARGRYKKEFGKMSIQEPTKPDPRFIHQGPEVTAAAALSICESLLLSLNDRKILEEHEILGVLRDAAAAHSNDPGDDGQRALHDDVAALINRIIDGGNSVRRR
jgi:hypothetical protein